MASVVVALTGSLVPAGLDNRLGRLWFFEIDFLVEVFLFVEVRLDHFRLLFEIVVEREAGIVLKAPSSRARRLRLQRHAGLEFVQWVRQPRRLLANWSFREGPLSRAFHNWLRSWTGRRNGPRRYRSRGWRGLFCLGSRRWRLWFFRRGESEHRENARPLALRFGRGRGFCRRLRAGRRRWSRWPGRCGRGAFASGRFGRGGCFARGDANLVEERIPVGGLGRIGHREGKNETIRAGKAKPRIVADEARRGKLCWGKGLSEEIK